MANQPPQPKSSLFQRFQQWLTRLRGGDVIVANIGEGASDVVVGKNIIKIGTLVIPALPAVLTLIALVLASAVAAYIVLVPSIMPQGTFNVAVAEFSQIDAQGHETVTADSALISRTLFTTIQGELEQLPADYPAIVWHDSIGPLKKRTGIGAITGATPAARSAAACKRAEALAASIIVYGVLDASSSPATLRLEFCVRDVSRNRDMGSLSEIQKIDRLGSPLPVELPLGDIQSSVNPVLRVRTTLLAKLVVGLRYELSSNPNFQANLLRALAVFEEAQQYLEQQDGAANNQNGGDVVAYFIGREYFFLFQELLSSNDSKSETARAKMAEYLEKARNSLEKATSLNADYARAWSALGAVHFQRIKLSLEAKRDTSDELTQAFTAYQKAIDAAIASQDQAAQAESHLGLAVMLWLQGDSYIYQVPSDPQAMEAAFARAEQQIALAEAIIQPEQNRMLGFTAMVRGVIAHDRAQVANQAGNKTAARTFFEQAQTYYTTCIAKGTADPGDMFLRNQVIAVTCVPYQRAVTQALQQLAGK